MGGRGTRVAATAVSGEKRRYYDGRREREAGGALG
jgi:hypothetical protein